MSGPESLSQFEFLQREWPAVREAAASAEANVHADARTACFHARRALELAVVWAYKHDAALKLPYQDNLSVLIHDPSFKLAAGEAVFNEARVISTPGNRAVHGARAIPVDDALVAVREMFHVAFWLARTCGRVARPAPVFGYDYLGFRPHANVVALAIHGCLRGPHSQPPVKPARRKPPAM